jgi:hypothetical protein
MGHYGELKSTSWNFAVQNKEPAPSVAAGQLSYHESWKCLLVVRRRSLLQFYCGDVDLEAVPAPRIFNDAYRR